MPHSTLIALFAKHKEKLGAHCQLTLNTISVKQNWMPNKTSIVEYRLNFFLFSYVLSWWKKLI